MKRTLILAITLVALCALSVHAAGILTATFINVGEGDSCWLHLPNSDDVLVDGGEPQAGPTVVAYLQQHGVTDLDLLVATHPDEDHIGGLPAVLAAMPVQVALSGSWTCTSTTCGGFYGSLAAHNVVTATVRAGQTYVWGDVSCLVLNPSEPLYTSSDNNNSIVLRITLGQVDVLLTGDAETGAEGRMLHSGLPLDAEILKVAHHGSNGATSERFLQAVHPIVAIISVGPNSYGHPRPEVLQRLIAAGASIYRTDLDGSVTVTTDGTSWIVARENTAAGVRAYLPIVAASAPR
jgi:competence protein ComEC